MYMHSPITFLFNGEKSISMKKQKEEEEEEEEKSCSVSHTRKILKKS
jgi:hypothetical protein